MTTEKNKIFLEKKGLLRFEGHFEEYLATLEDVDSALKFFETILKDVTNIRGYLIDLKMVVQLKHELELELELQKEKGKNDHT